MTTYFLTAFPRYSNVNTAGAVVVEHKEIVTMAPVEIQTSLRYGFPSRVKDVLSIVVKLC